MPHSRESAHAHERCNLLPNYFIDNFCANFWISIFFIFIEVGNEPDFVPSVDIEPLGTVDTLQKRVSMLILVVPLCETHTTLRYEEADRW